MEFWLLGQYGAVGVLAVAMIAWLRRLQGRLDHHETDCSERNEKLSNTLGRIDERLARGDTTLEALVESNNQLNQSVAVLLDRGDR